MTFMLRSLLIMLPLIAGTVHAEDTRRRPSDPAIDHSFMAVKADPCGNFFRYACGGWIDANPIPADQSSWGLDQELMQRNQLQLRAILEKAAQNPTPDTRKIGDFYAACMDEAGIDKKGLAPLGPELEKIDALDDKAKLPAL